MKFSQRVVDYFIQAFFIFSSVFLAFWLTDYNNTKLKKKNLDISLNQIGTELSYNHQQIERVYEYHVYILAQIDSILKLPNKNPEVMDVSQLNGWRGMQMPILRSTAYSTFVNTNISVSANVGLTKSLADIYNIQLVIEKLNNSLFDIAVSDNSIRTLNKLRQIFGIYVEVLPEVILIYQTLGKEHLQKYGYNKSIKSKKLENYIHLNLNQLEQK